MRNAVRDVGSNLAKIAHGFAMNLQHTFDCCSCFLVRQVLIEVIAGHEAYRCLEFPLHPDWTGKFRRRTVEEVCRPQPQPAFASIQTNDAQAATFCFNASASTRSKTSSA